MGTCGKRRYEDKIAAMFALSQCRKSPKGKRREVRAYFCPVCRGWHLTKQPKNVENF